MSITLSSKAVMGMVRDLSYEDLHALKVIVDEELRKQTEEELRDTSIPVIYRKSDNSYDVDKMIKEYWRTHGLSTYGCHVRVNLFIREGI